MIIDYTRSVFYEGRGIYPQVGLDIALTTADVVELRPVNSNGVAACHIAIPLEQLGAAITALGAIRDRPVIDPA